MLCERTNVREIVRLEIRVESHLSGGLLKDPAKRNAADEENCQGNRDDVRESSVTSPKMHASAVIALVCVAAQVSYNGVAWRTGYQLNLFPCFPLQLCDMM